MFPTATAFPYLSTGDLLKKLPPGASETRLRQLVTDNRIPSPARLGKRQAWPSDEAAVRAIARALVEADYVDPPENNDEE